MKQHIRHFSAVVITSALHAEGPQFEPGQCQIFIIGKIQSLPLLLHKYYFWISKLCMSIGGAVGKMPELESRGPRIKSNQAPDFYGS